MNILLKRLVMTRPYSWIGVVSVAILANVLASGNLVLDHILGLDVITALLAWFVATSIVEYFHRKIDGRPWTNPYIPIISTLVLALLLIYRNPLTLILLAIIVISGFLYSMKIKSFFLSGFSFVIRGILEVAIFIIILLSNQSYEIAAYIPIMAVIFLVTDARNLIGDIRDVEYDKYIFPKRYGTNLSYAVSAILVVVSALILWDILLALPLLLFLLAIPISRNAYSLHRIFVLSTTFFYVNYIAMALAQSLVITNILFLAALLNFTYPAVPRKSNPRGVQFYSYRG